MKRLYVLIPLVSVLIITTVQVLSADTWIENFEDKHLDAWAVDNTSDRTTWQTKNRHLNVWIEPDQVDGPRSHILEFIGFDFRAEELNVKVTILEVHNAQVGILIGQYTEDKNPYRRTYDILHGTIWGPIEFPGRIPNVEFNDLNEIEIAFNKGDFELLSNGKHILEFDQPNLPYIDCLGIVAYASRGPIAHFILDDFTISGPSIPSKAKLDVHSNGKVTIVWGKLKQR